MQTSHRQKNKHRVPGLPMVLQIQNYDRLRSNIDATVILLARARLRKHI